MLRPAAYGCCLPLRGALEPGHLRHQTARGQLQLKEQQLLWPQAEYRLTIEVHQFGRELLAPDRTAEFMKLEPRGALRWVALSQRALATGATLQKKGSGSPRLALRGNPGKGLQVALVDPADFGSL